MCMRDRTGTRATTEGAEATTATALGSVADAVARQHLQVASVSYTHLRAHETVLDLVCRLLLEKKKH